jgi:hypothetical protein
MRHRPIVENLGIADITAKMLRGRLDPKPENTKPLTFCYRELSTF